MRGIYDGLAVALTAPKLQKVNPAVWWKLKNSSVMSTRTKRMQKEGGKLNLINYALSPSRRLCAQFIATLLAKQ